MAIKAEKMYNILNSNHLFKPRFLKITQNMLNAPFGMNITGFLMSEGHIL